MKKLILSNPLAVAKVFSIYGIKNEPTFGNFLAAYSIYGESFLLKIYNEIGNKAYFLGFKGKKKQNEFEPQSEDKKPKDWTKFRKEANGWLNLAANATVAGFNVFNAIRDKDSKTEFSYTDSEYGFNVKTNTGDPDKSFIEKNALYIGLGVVLLLFFLMSK